MFLHQRYYTLAIDSRLSSNKTKETAPTFIQHRKILQFLAYSYDKSKNHILGVFEFKITPQSTLNYRLLFLGHVRHFT